MTSPVPIASDSGKFRRGSLTSPAVNVTLFQASAENREPTCATHTAISSPIAPPVADTDATNDRSDLIGDTPIGVHKCVKLVLIASALRPMNRPRAISASKDSVLAEVNTFWMSLPSRRPRVFRIVKNTITRIATNCCVERLMA